METLDYVYYTYYYTCIVSVLSTILLYHFSRPSVADDSVEERKLRTPQRKTNQPPRSLTDHRPSSQNGGGVANNQEGAESSGSEDVDGGGVVDGAWPGESSPQLREMIKTEREQKVRTFP